MAENVVFERFYEAHYGDAGDGMPGGVTLVATSYRGVITYAVRTARERGTQVAKVRRGAAYVTRKALAGRARGSRSGAAVGGRGRRRGGCGRGRERRNSYGNSSSSGGGGNVGGGGLGTRYVRRANAGGNNTLRTGRHLL
ncbi:hypothetical protein DL765_008566 [Monosporascus sp. GIB2]|nr:hypothetical protein DL765_008566 [Monosporascus sp. GIB2]